MATGNGNKTNQSASRPDIRPYATIDVKATEIKVTEIKNMDSFEDMKVPAPAPAWTFATKDQITGAAKASAPAAASPKPSERTENSTAASRQAPAANGPVEHTVIEKHRGGFLSHLAAAALGGIVALAGYTWVLPTFLPEWAADSDRLAARIAAIEEQTQRTSGALVSDTDVIEDRITALEQQTDQIPALVDAQKKLVADTKAALAADASDAGGPDLLIRLSGIEDRLRKIESGNVTAPDSTEPGSAGNGAVSDLKNEAATLRQELASELEGKISTLSQQSQNALTSAERAEKSAEDIKQQVTSLQSSLSDLSNSAVKTSDLTSSLTPIEDRISKLDQKIAGIEASEAKRLEQAEQVLLSVELQSLKRAIEKGETYNEELEAIQARAGDSIDLSALEAHKTKGVPTLVELNEAFDKAANAAIDTQANKENAGIVDRLLSSAKSVVRVRKVDHGPDDKSVEAIVGRMETALEDGRLDDMLQESKELPPEAQAAMQPFVEKAEARVSIFNVLAQVQDQIKTSLGTPAAQP